MNTHKAGMVIHPVDDLEAALAFYQGTLGLELEFRDGERFAALDAGGTRIALAAGDERISSRVAVSFKVDDVDAAIEELQQAGATLVRPPADGPHERRAVLQDPSGHDFVIYHALQTSEA